jgi:hypothetical protein
MKRDHLALLRFLEERSAMPFEWGRNDCVSFAARAVRVQTGRRLLGRLRWRSLTGARRNIERLGGLETAIDERLERIAPAEAMRGDIAGVPNDVFGIRLMIVEGASLAGPGTRGVRRLPRSAMVAAWSITGG